MKSNFRPQCYELLTREVWALGTSEKKKQMYACHLSHMLHAEFSALQNTGFYNCA